MKIIDNVFTTEEKFPETYVAIGSFDGIHTGHKEVILSAVKKAKENKGKSVVFTFANHPMEIVDKSRVPKLINSQEEKIHILEDMGVDYVVFQPFDGRFASIAPFDFVEYVLKKKLNSREIFVGFNFSFGEGGVAKTDDLIELGKAVNIVVNKIPPVKIDDRVISSTLIRKLILKGDLEKVRQYLGYSVFIIGEVIHGRKYGRKMGFPTANLSILNKVYPPFGIYGASVRIEGEDIERDAVVNIGRNPTLKPGEQSIEVHILDFDEYIYGKKLYLKLIKFLREEKRFSSMDELKDVIRNDVLTWKNYLEEVKDGYNT
jgi:riboflavin kinase/FMN adenylyltransferase